MLRAMRGRHLGMAPGTRDSNQENAYLDPEITGGDLPSALRPAPQLMRGRGGPDMLAVQAQAVIDLLLLSGVATRADWHAEHRHGDRKWLETDCRADVRAQNAQSISIEFNSQL
mmetsp:Transcript_51012/g.119302  ORF Transcript_51012/g.119302 Transcript_51012/m.119302 type:complete len:114 (+) Transcript_51012:1511-1852(+)